MHKFIVLFIVILSIHCKIGSIVRLPFLRQVSSATCSPNNVSYLLIMGEGVGVTEKKILSLQMFAKTNILSLQKRHICAVIMVILQLEKCSDL